MYGTCETLCRLLREQYPAETPLNLIVWSPADIEALADGMEYAVSEQDTRAVLARMDAIPEEQRLESGVSAGAVMDLIEQVKEAVPAVMVPADLLETLLRGWEVWELPLVAVICRVNMIRNRHKWKTGQMLAA